MSVAAALAVSTIAVGAFMAGRLSAARAIRHLREALAWRERLDSFPYDFRPTRTASRRRRRKDPTS